MKPRGPAHPFPSASHWRWLNLPFIAVVFAYRVTLGHFTGGHCRFHPSCSRYATEAFQTLNPITALWLTARRVARCHPWGGGGYDPVPLRDVKKPSRPEAI